VFVDTKNNNNNNKGRHNDRYDGSILTSQTSGEAAEVVPDRKTAIDLCIFIHGD